MKLYGIIKSGIAALGLIALLALPMSASANGGGYEGDLDLGICARLSSGEGGLEELIFELFDLSFSNEKLCVQGCRNSGSNCLRIAHAVYLCDLALINSDSALERLDCQDDEVGTAKVSCMQEANSENRSSTNSARASRGNFTDLCVQLEADCTHDCED